MRGEERRGVCGEGGQPRSCVQVPGEYACCCWLHPHPAHLCGGLPPCILPVPEERRREERRREEMMMRGPDLSFADRWTLLMFV